MHQLAVALHLLAVVAWTGGLLFLCVLLPPVLAVEEPAARHAVWARLLPRFFTLAWAAAAVGLASGFALMFSLYGGFAVAGLHIHVMAGLGILMTLILLYTYARPLKRFEEAEEQADDAAADAALRSLLGWQRASLLLGVGALIAGGVGGYIGFGG
ncbi:MAG: CopD family protein [Caenispirillum bisanense]|nr:CopD family protein [Caenispirillum bisanense]MCA1972330.1 CopD family protein [Caenispirillum sp.]